MGRRDRRHRAPRPADPADRGHRDLRHGPALAQRLLGTDGGCLDGRLAGSHGADPSVPAGALRRLVQGETAGRRCRRRAVTARSAGPGPCSGVITMPIVASLLITASAAIVLVFGLLHLFHTYRGSMLHPRESGVMEAMQQSGLRLTRQTTVW